MSLPAELLSALRRHWPHYLAEAAGLAVFISCASLLTLALEHLTSPLRQALMAHGVSKPGRQVPMGMGRPVLWPRNRANSYLAAPGRGQHPQKTPGPCQKQTGRA